MKQLFSALALLLLTVNVFGQASYVGYIDKYPIELVTYIYSDGIASAFYVYTKFDTPIRINGTLKNGVLTLEEKDAVGKLSANLIFNDFKADSKSIQGIRRDLNTGKVLEISLKKSFDIGYGNGIEWQDRELLQPVSLKDKYFKVLIGKDKENFYATVTGIKIFEKRTDKLLQEFKMECALWGIDNVQTGDYNFDGFPDFSVFEHSYAGPNTSSLYFLFDPKTKAYFLSSFAGTSLDFDARRKRIYEHNQCCAGRSHMNAEYKVVNNKMVLIKKTCLEYDEKLEDFKKVKCE